MSIFDKYPRLLDMNFVEEYDLHDCWTARSKHNSYSDEDVAVAIIRHHGNYSAIARALGRSRSSVQNFIAHETLLRDLRGEIVQGIVDDIEERYMLDALNGDTGARRFFLQTLGKDRGYVVRNENTGKDGGPVHLASRIKVSNLSDAALEEILSAEGAE
jgi:predicted transcriptional regulator